MEWILGGEYRAQMNVLVPLVEMGTELTFEYNGDKFVTDIEGKRPFQYSGDLNIIEQLKTQSATFPLIEGKEYVTESGLICLCAHVDTDINLAQLVTGYWERFSVYLSDGKTISEIGRGGELFIKKEVLSEVCSSKYDGSEESYEDRQDLLIDKLIAENTQLKLKIKELEDPPAVLQPEFRELVRKMVAEEKEERQRAISDALGFMRDFPM